MKTLFQQNLVKEILRRKDENVTYLDVINEIMCEWKLDPWDLGEFIKEDKTLMEAVTQEAKQAGWLKHKPEDEFDISDLF